MDFIAFTAAFKNAPPQPLLEADLKQIPREAGVYILFARNTEFIYPCGKSSVFYIGQSQSLRGRLRKHMNKTREAKSDRRRLLYELYYEYGTAFQGAVHVYSGQRKLQRL